MPSGGRVVWVGLEARSRACAYLGNPGGLRKTPCTPGNSQNQLEGGRMARMNLPKRLLVDVTLKEHWKETITHAEAVRRLATRNLSESLRKLIRASIPKRTDHYLALHENALIEYADFGEGFARM